MRTKLLDYYKIILDKVSFDTDLFAKEYKKALSALPASEAADLNSWLRVRNLQNILARQRVSDSQMLEVG